MRVFITGATGFLGSQVASLLAQRGDQVVALVRSRARATALLGMGAEIVDGGLNDRIAIDRGVDGADAVIHLAARYEVGIPKTECTAMEDVNIGGTRRVLDSVIEHQVPRTVYVSTINVFGNTHGTVVDETYERKDLDFLSCYDSSKYKAHELAMSRVAEGGQIVIVQPGVIYGPGDHSEVGRQLLMAAHGRMALPMLTDVGLSLTHVNDVAAGIVAALDTGVIGESYLLAGDNVYLRDALELIAALAGKRIPRRDVPKFLVKAVAPAGPFISKFLGYPPNMRELVRAADGVTYWADSTKAKEALGYSTISLEEGMRSLL